MVRGARYAFVVLAWAFVAGVVLQVFFIGLGLFAGSREPGAPRHLRLDPAPVPDPDPARRRAGAGRTDADPAGDGTGRDGVHRADPGDASSRYDRWSAAFHPVGALLAFWLAIVVARGATSLVRANDADAPAAVAPIGG